MYPVNFGMKKSKGDYYYDNSLIKMYDIDLVDSLDNPCCFIDMCNVCDLDEANGRTGVTPEFPNGTYYYVITDSFPVISRCISGNPSVDFKMP